MSEDATNPTVPLPEEPLLGGDVTEGVVRVGDTVRRPTGRHSTLVHQVLTHLEEVGFSGAPRFLGVDEHNREILTYLPGEVAQRPWPAWVAHPERAASVATLLRALDDAMVPWGLPDLSTSDQHDPDNGPPACGPEPTFIGHRDVTPENVVFRSGRAVALIDFDLARPSSRVDEFCNLALWWAPLMPTDDRDDVMVELDAPSRLKLLADTYRLGRSDREHVLTVAINSAQRTWFLMRDRAVHDGGGWQRMWDDGVGDRIRRRESWLRENARVLHESVTSS